jgi:hypothetical protein
MKHGAVLLVALVAAGCMTQPAQKVNLDVRGGHSKAALHWTDSSTAHETPNVDVTIQLPSGRTFSAQNVTLHLFGQGDKVQLIAVMYPKASLDDVYRQARQVSHDWQLPTGGLDGWYQDVQNGRKSGVKDSSVELNVGTTGSPIGTGGPTPYVKILPSYDDGSPALLDFELQWA